MWKSESDLQKQWPHSEWPKKEGSVFAGSRIVSGRVSAAALVAIGDVVATDPTAKIAQNVVTSAQWYIYSLGSTRPIDATTNGTAFGWRDPGSFAVHWKVTMQAGRTDELLDRAWSTPQRVADISAQMRAWDRRIGNALDAQLTCRNFYNYASENMTCASTDDEWLGAVFTDPQRVLGIESEEDPGHLSAVASRGGLLLRPRGRHRRSRP